MVLFGADTSPLRAVLPFQESPVFRSAYLQETVHWTIYCKTLDLQGLPLRVNLKGSLNAAPIVTANTQNIKDHRHPSGF